MLVEAYNLSQFYAWITNNKFIVFSFSATLNLVFSRNKDAQQLIAEGTISIQTKMLKTQMESPDFQRHYTAYLFANW